MRIKTKAKRSNRHTASQIVQGHKGALASTNDVDEIPVRSGKNRMTEEKQEPSTTLLYGSYVSAVLNISLESFSDGQR